LVVPAVAALALGASVLSARGFGDNTLLYASLNLCWCIATLAAFAGLYLRWRLTGEATIGLLAVAFAVLALPQLPLAVADVASKSTDLARSTDPLVQLAVVLPTAWLLMRCVRTTQVDSSLRPLRLGVICGVGAAMAVVAVTLATQQGWLPPTDPNVAGAVDLVVAGGAFWFARLFATRAQSAARPLTSRMSVVFVGLGLGAALSALARAWWAPLWVLSGLVSLSAVVLLGLLATSLLQTVLDFHSLRMLTLSLRANSAEETVRREQERMHELRATVAGIRSASGTLSRYEDQIDADRKQNIEQMMTDELARLERLLSSETDLATLGPVMLDDVIRPLVVRHREQGMTVHWRPTGACALIRADEVAEIVNVLLTNAHRHAPGSPVTVTVDDLGHHVRVTIDDSGPGVSTEVAERLFDRGSRSSLSPGQGLGLHIAQRLAANQAGTLALVDTPTEPGARFALTMRAAPPIDGGPSRREGSSHSSRAPETSAWRTSGYDRDE
jgi:signal transduction histidine kinase